VKARGEGVGGERGKRGKRLNRGATPLKELLTELDFGFLRDFEGGFCPRKMKKKRYRK